MLGVNVAAAEDGGGFEAGVCGGRRAGRRVSLTALVGCARGAREGLFTAVFNVTGDPALVLPCGWDADGLPFGIQLSGRLGADLPLLEAASLVEQALAFERRDPGHGWAG